MEWIDFLRSVAIQHKLNPEMTETLIARLNLSNASESSNAKVAAQLNISEALVKKRLSHIYEAFGQGCPDLSTSESRGKLEALKACLWSKYQDECEVSPSRLPDSPSHNLPPNNLPQSGVAKFVGRKKELQQLHQQLQANDSVAISAIAGMGGVGKTELALQYGIHHREDYFGGICWINSRGSDVGTQIAAFAANELRLQSDHIGDVEGRVRYCWNNWSRSGNVLVVFDDAVTYGQIKPYLPPQQSRFRVLITTRKRLGSPVVRIDLDVLNPDDAIELLKSLIGSERVERELEIATQLCSWLGRLPLALELVGRYLQRHETQTIETLLSQLREKDSLRHSATAETTEEMTARRGLAAAFDLSWDELTLQAKKLGCLLSLFGLAEVPLPLVERAINQSASRVSTTDLSILEDLRTEFSNGAEQSNVVADLIGLNLIRPTSQGMYRLHELIREFFQSKLNELPQTEALQQEFSEGMLSVAQQTFESSNFAKPELKVLLDFLLQVPAEGRSNRTLLEFLELLSQYYSVQQYIYDTGYLESAIDQLELAKAYLVQLGESNNLKAQVTNGKLLGHAYYANPAQNRNLAIENMMIAREIASRADQTTTSDAEHQIWLWYQVFLLDHVHNLLSKPSDQSSVLVPEELEVQIAELLPTSLEQANDPPDPDVLPSLLRAAHYWGHRGNQVTFKMETLLRESPSNHSEEIESLLEDGLNYYSLASIFRAANFRLSFPQQYQQHLADVLDEVPNIPEWLLTWNPPVQSLDFERFTSSSQAVGDIAHQYRGMATVQLFGHFYNVSRGLNSSLLEEARSVVEVASRLWEKAKILLTPNEQIIRYYTWMANLEIMLQLLTHYGSDAQLPSQADVDREVAQKLDELEREYGLVYDWARNQTIRQTDQFYTMISGLRRL